MQTKPGLKLRGTACSTEVVVVRPAKDDVEIACCGAPMAEADGAAGPAAAPDAASSPAEHDILLGKRYADEESGLELLCTQPGPGPLSADGRELAVKGPKPLPASD